MDEGRVGYTVYATKPPFSLGWDVRSIVVDRDEAPERINALHPEIVTYRIITQGACKRSIIDDDFASSSAREAALLCYWFFDEEWQCWYAPNELPPRPETDLTPASLIINTDPPEFGWWRWNLVFTPSVATMQINEEIKIPIHCSAVFDPIEKLLHAIEILSSPTQKNIRIMINEEGNYVNMLVWSLSSSKLHVRICSECYRQGYCHDFLLDKENFLFQLWKSHRHFEFHGGWGDSNEPE